MQHLLEMDDKILNNQQLQLQLHFALHQLLMDLLRLNYMHQSQLHLLDTINFRLAIMIVHIVQFDLNVINNEAIVTIYIVCMEAQLHSSFVLYYKSSNNKNEYNVYTNNILQLPKACNICKMKNISSWHLSCTNNVLGIYHQNLQILIRKHFSFPVYYIQVILIKQLIYLSNNVYTQ